MKNTLLNHLNGGTIFGHVVGVSNPHYTVEEAPVILKFGIEKGQGSFGAEHIWHRHGSQITSMGYRSLAQVPHFVAAIVRPNSLVLRDFTRTGGPKLIILRNNLGMAILQLQTLQDGKRAYSVVTAYRQRSPRGQQVTVIR